MGGIVALQLVALYHMKAKRLKLFETNLKPASSFYRNLMLPQNKEIHQDIIQMIQEESIYCPMELKKCLQDNFDYTVYINHINDPIELYYGDRGQPDYPYLYQDLCLGESILKRCSIQFIKDACHMPMIENPQEFIRKIKKDDVQTSSNGMNLKIILFLKFVPFLLR